MNDEDKAERLTAIGWKEGYFDSGITLLEIEEAVINGFGECSEPEECDSRILCGHACRCIRQAFTCPEAYEFYRAVSHDYEKEKAKRILARTVFGRKEEK
jgi:hypothetical protein